MVRYDHLHDLLESFVALTMSHRCTSDRATDIDERLDLAVCAPHRDQCRNDFAREMGMPSFSSHVARSSRVERPDFWATWIVDRHICAPSTHEPGPSNLKPQEQSQRSIVSTVSTASGL